MTTLVVSATKVEAAHVPSGLPVLITGMGKVAAASAVARRLATDPAITQVINIGSCGALREGLSGIHEIGRVLNHDLSADAVRALGDDPQEWLTLTDSPCTLATGDLFVHETTHKQRLAELAHLVDMEGYAVAWAARQAGVPVTLIKHVSDAADEAALEWHQVIDDSARELAEWVRARL